MGDDEGDDIEDGEYHDINARLMILPAKAERPSATALHTLESRNDDDSTKKRSRIPAAKRNNKRNKLSNFSIANSKSAVRKSHAPASEHDKGSTKVAVLESRQLNLKHSSPGVRSLQIDNVTFQSEAHNFTRSSVAHKVPHRASQKTNKKRTKSSDSGTTVRNGTNDEGGNGVAGDDEGDGNESHKVIR